MKQDIRKLALTELMAYVIEVGDKAFRGKQIWQWLWEKSAHSFEEMSNLSLALRVQLTKDFEFRPITIHTHQKSNDGTIKLAFSLYDQELIEGVLIVQRAIWIERET
jgi:23S rRNA (adenine2503-C2)-methyltransferase